MQARPPEPFVDAHRAATFLQLKHRRILELARSGELPGYRLGSGVRRIWRFRLSELAIALERLGRPPASLVYLKEKTSYRSKPPKRLAGSR